MIPSGLNRRTQSGYILILNIGVLALMLLGATYMGKQMSTALVMARAEQQAVQNEQDISDAKAKLLFLLSSLPRTSAGLGIGQNSIVPDGRTYRLDDRIAVQIQDIRGLVSVNGLGIGGAGRQIMERLLGTYGLDSDTTARLVDTLLDYRDGDNLRRINGAEQEEYAAAGTSHLLRNADLLVPTELARIHGWAEIAALWGDDPITNHISVHPRPVLNPNAADWRVLVALGGIAPEMAKDLLQSRRRGEITDITSLVAPGLSGDPFAGGPVIIKTPSDSLLITFLPREGHLGQRIAVNHTPESERCPWRIQYTERIAVSAVSKNWEDTPPLPDLRQLRDASKPNQVQLPF